jgi:cytochrome P450
MRTAPTVRIDRSIRRALATFDADRLRWLDEAAALGPIAGLRLGPATTWVVSDPEAARTMLVTRGDSWTRPPAMTTPIRLGVGENLFTQRDKAWARLAPQLTPMFRKRALDARFADLDELVRREVAALPIGEEIDLELATGRIALILAAWVLLGEHLDRDKAAELADHQRQIVTWVGHRLSKLTAAVPFAFGASTRVMREHRRALEAYADEVIARSQGRDRAGKDVLGALISARPNDKPLRADELRAHVLGLLLAGNETTAAALSWALVHAARNPAEWARLRTEPERARVFVDETLRITPAVWGLARTPTRKGVALEAVGHTLRVRRPEVVTVYIRGANHNPITWPDPHRFDPDRHLTNTRHQERALIPFGLGPRGCVGQHVAMAEMLAALPALARRGNIRIDHAVTEDASFALRVAGGLRGRFTAVETCDARVLR